MQSSACLFVTEVAGIYQINSAATDSTGALPSRKQPATRLFHIILKIITKNIKILQNNFKQQKSLQKAAVLPHTQAGWERTMTEATREEHQQPYSSSKQYCSNPDIIVAFFSPPGFIIGQYSSKDYKD